MSSQHLLNRHSGTAAPRGFLALKTAPFFLLRKHRDGCLICPRTTFSSGGACLTCPPGKEPSEVDTPGAAAGFVGSSHCIDCQRGNFSADGITCDACQPGNEPVAEVAAESCQHCGAGKYSAVGGACSSCPDGQGENALSTWCERCEHGRFSIIDPSDGSNHGCGKCPGGQQATEAGDNCEDCAVGRFRSGAPTAAETICTFCGTGFQPSAAQDSCVSCGEISSASYR